MTAFHAVATAVVYAACANVLALEVGHLADREYAVRLSWADGVAWCVARRTQVARLSRALLLAALRAAFPARGRHQTGVTA